MQKTELEINKLAIRKSNTGDSKYFLPVVLSEVKCGIPFNNTSRRQDDFVNELTIGEIRDTGVIKNSTKQRRRTFIVQGIPFPLGWN